MKTILNKVNSAYFLLSEKVRDTFFYNEVSNSYASLFNKKLSDFSSKPVKQVLPEDEYIALNNFLIKAKRNNFP